MEEGLRGGVCPQLLDLMPNKRDWIVKDDGRGGEMKASQVEVESLELRLGLPATEEEKDPSVLSLSLFYKSSKTTTTTTNNKNHHCAGSKRGFFGTFESRTEGPQQQKTSGANLKDELHQSQERKAAHEVPENASAANMNSQTRAASVPLVGWPPIRTFRKNLATGSSKLPPEPQSGDLQSKVKLENCKKGLFVKINMEGIPIGRKIDLSTYNSYEKLSLAVEEHFRDLLAAQKDPSTAETMKDEEKQVFTGLLDGTGEYSLIYEDNEGDRMLVGDVPWDMFVSTAKRLRVIRSTDLSVIRV
ncbi:AUX/IAA family [Musa troglodytarum]|nr:AUX/IAA family [Musa troglodytarum]